MLKSESKNQWENAAEEKKSEVKILFADDMEINKMIFEKMIAPWEIAVDYVEDGKAAVEAVRNRNYQLVFLDNMMPEMTGCEAAVQIRRFSSVPLVVVTADTSKDCEEWKESGFNDFMTKPFKIESLKRILDNYLPANFSQGLCNIKQDFSQTKTQKMLLGRKTLETFAEETEVLLTQLKKYMEQDKEFLRMKVHGIKGACRQVGQVSMGEIAENMEIAVETDNMSYVQHHMDDFIFMLKKTVEIVREQIASLPKEISDENELVINEKTVLWRELKEAFADYAIDDIERILEQLKRTDLTEEEREILLKAEKCGNEFEYEEGYNLL